MKRGAVLVVLLLSGAVAVRVAARGAESVPEKGRPVLPTVVPPPPEPAPSIVAAAPERDPLTVRRGNAACDRILGLEQRVRLYRTALGHPSDEWIRLVNHIRIAAGELWEPPPGVASDAALVFEPGGFERIQAGARELSLLAGEYYEAARTRNRSSVATLRPAFDAKWESFLALARRSVTK